MRHTLALRQRERVELSAAVGLLVELEQRLACLERIDDFVGSSGPSARPNRLLDGHPGGEFPQMIALKASCRLIAAR